MAFAPDGKTLASSNGSDAIIWDVDTGIAQDTLRGHKGQVLTIAYMPSGRRLATGSADGTIKIWRTRNGSLDYTLAGHKDNVSCLTYSRNGGYLASGGYDQTVKIWNTKTRLNEVTIKVAAKEVNSICFSPFDKYLLAASGSNRNNSSYTQAWDLKNPKALVSLQSTFGPVRCLSISPSGDRLLIGRRLNPVQVLDLRIDRILEAWHDEGKHAELSLAQLQQFQLEDLLSLRPGNERRLIATGELWQIKAFADLASEKARESDVLEKVEGQFKLASRLYQAALKIEQNRFIARGYKTMLLEYASVCNDRDSLRADSLKRVANIVLPD